MNIFTKRILQYRPEKSILSQKLNLSQEYRALATLKYLFPEKYDSFTAGDAPDLQNIENSMGVEVTAAVPEKDMKVARLFSYLCEGNNVDRQKHLISAISKENYSVAETTVGLAAISPIATSVSEKVFIQNIISKKMEKLPQYQEKYKRVELALILPEIPTSDAERHITGWITDIMHCARPAFDYVHIICHRFYKGLDMRTGEEIKIAISNRENLALGAIARMTAEGVISFDSEEWH